ncbi:ABC-F type ribosomal protection protein [Oscillibacter sp. MSJ-2]|uniref:ABC-F type ribosomal protection protein n=1 Tax=Dysosmobacter acutus TaxID=2841504 RepID=A0ABS6F8U3_9FIRM|nr:ABC-F type ribosomal protection protein [Dysosmobacter acutus]MBU5626051.1 ABC-F type ribosomal protection protein [Dysosmobacter acutus]
MSMIQVTNLTFAYEGSYDFIFEDVSFQIDTNWKTGLIGRNGRGKTTLLRLLRGEFDYEGSIEAPVDVDYFPNPVPDPSLSTADVLERICPEAMEWELLRELGQLKVDGSVLRRPFSTLSGGEQIKVQMAALFCRESHFLLLDEPTNHLDADARRTVAAYLRGKRGFILVSHDRAFLDGCVDHILSINKSNVEVQRGTFSSWWENKQRQDAWEQERNQQLRQDIGRLQSAADRAAQWSSRTEKGKFHAENSGLRPDRGFVGHKAAKMMQHSKSIEQRRRKAAEEKGELLKNLEKAEPLKLHPVLYHASRLVELRSVSVAYDGREVCAPVSFTLCRGERIALSGRNGSGKSSLLRLICGEEVPHTGVCTVPDRLIISRVPQSTEGLRGPLRCYARACGVDETLFLAILRKLDLDRVQFEKDLSEYSEGQKKKVLIARSLSESAHLYVWDEPLNYIDIYSRMQVEELIREFQPTMLFVEHDAAFRENAATAVVDL